MCHVSCDSLSGARLRHSVVSITSDPHPSPSSGPDRTRIIVKFVRQTELHDVMLKQDCDSGRVT